MGSYPRAAHNRKRIREQGHPAGLPWRRALRWTKRRALRKRGEDEAPARERGPPARGNFGAMFRATVQAEHVQHCCPVERTHAARVLYYGVHYGVRAETSQCPTYQGYSEQEVRVFATKADVPLSSPRHGELLAWGAGHH